MALDEAAVAEAVAEVARILRADGADLLLVEADPRTDRIRLKLDLEGVSCEECVLPPELLEQVIGDSLGRRVPGELEILIDDPRRAGAS